MAEVSQHFVTFFSPGTIVAETSTKPVDSWSVDLAKRLALEITERYNAKPFGFYFTTRSRGPLDLDSKETAKSNFYYLGGRIETIEEVNARNDPNERILRSNMKINGWNKIIVNDNSWRFTAPLRDTDVVLEWPLP